MAKDGKHVIHAGGVFPNPLLNREGGAAAATQPGTIGVFTNGKFTASTNGGESAVLYVANYDYAKMSWSLLTASCGFTTASSQTASGIKKGQQGR